MNHRAVFSISFVAAISTVAMAQPSNTLRVEYTRKVIYQSWQALVVKMCRW